MPNLSSINFTPASYDPLRLDKVLCKLRMCPNFGTLIAMEGDLNEIGLTIHHIGANKLIICRIENQQPKASEVLEDFMLIGELNSQLQEVTPRLIECLTSFIIKAAGAPSKIVTSQKSYQHGPILYGAITPTPA